MKKTLPKIHLACCNKNDIRVVFEYILVTKEEVVATNMYIMVIHKTKAVFDEDFIKAMPDRFLMHRSQWADICKPHAKIWFEDDNICVSHDSPIPYVNRYEIRLEGTSIEECIEHNIKFPNYESVANVKKDLTATDNINFNPNLMQRLCKSMGIPDDMFIIKMKFRNSYDGILVTERKIDTGVIGVIMPDVDI